MAISEYCATIESAARKDPAEVGFAVVVHARENRIVLAKVVTYHLILEILFDFRRNIFQQLDVIV